MITVGVVGARRQRQGLGSYVIRDLLAAGAEVPCIAGTSQETLDVARRELVERWAIAPRGYLDVHAMLAEEDLDAIAICSPADTHEAYLDAALDAGLHVLCEKPLVWGRGDLAAATRRIVSGFASRRLVLWENCQWPYTLSAFEALHPGTLHAPPRCFEMRLQPGSRGVQMLGDAVPHPLSLLQALCPDPDPAVEEVAFRCDDPDAASVEIAFAYRSEYGRTDVSLHLEQGLSWPREAEIAIDGRRARRLVSRQRYRLSFADGDRSVSVADPLGLLVADFVRELRERSERSVDAPRSREIIARMRLLEAIVTAHARIDRGSH